MSVDGWNIFISSDACKNRMYCFPPLENCFPEPSQQRLHRAFVVNQVCTCAMCFFLLALFWEQGMMVYYHADRLVRAVSYVRRGDLERGKFATPQEVAEAGSPDCSICYERMVRPVLLPCEHMFCGECVTEWLEREHTCPLCRLEIPTTNPIPRSLRNGHTSILPQIL